MLALLKGMRTRENCFILNYHRLLSTRINGNGYVQPGMYVTANTFRQHLEILNDRFIVLSLNELADRVKAGKSIGGCCAITFDDGWQDNYALAFPIFTEMAVPVTVFLATAFVGSERMFWPEELSFYLRQEEVKTFILSGGTKLLTVKSSHYTDEIFFDDIIQTVKSLSPEKRNELLNQLRTASSKYPVDRLLLNWEEVKSMHASGFCSFGSHTANHVILDQVSLKEAELEISRSKEELELHLGRSTLFAYPNGNYSYALQDILKRHGFSVAVTTQKGWVDMRTNLLAIPRISMHEDVSNTKSLLFARILLRSF